MESENILNSKLEINKKPDDLNDDYSRSMETPQRKELEDIHETKSFIKQINIVLNDDDSSSK